MHRDRLTGYVWSVANLPEQIKQSVTTALELGCKNVISAKEKRSSTWEIDVLIAGIRQTLLQSMTSIIKIRVRKQRPSMSRGTNGKGRSKLNVGEAASHVGVQVYHTGQGQDERARTRPPHLLRGLDSAWSGGSNPHRESGTRWRAAADVGAGEGQESRSAEGRRGNRLGDSVGACALRTREVLRSAERAQRDVMEWGGLDSGGVWPGRMRKPRRFKGRGLIAGLVHPHAIDDAHPDVGQGTDRHTVGLAFCPFALVIGQRPGFLPRRLPGELVQGVAQRLHARKAFVRFGVIAAFKRHGRRSGQGLDTAGIGIAAAILAPFGQQTGSQALARSRQRPPDL